MIARRRRLLGLALVASLPAFAAAAIAATGSLTYSGCLANRGKQGCERPRDNALGNNVGIAVSPDGSQVYVVSVEGTLMRLSSTRPSQLTYEDCFADRGRHDCRDIPHDSINSAAGVAVSPDGASIYVTSGQRTNAITRFKLGSTGQLRYRSCLANGGAHGGTGGCAKPPRNSLDSNEAMAMSPDGSSAYVVSSDSDSITRFARRAKGALVYRGCIANGGARGCKRAKHGSLGGAFDVAVSPDGRSVYVASMDGDSITRFNRDPTGALTYKGCFANGHAHGCRAPDHDSLGGAVALAVSPDGESVYVASLRAGAVTHFDRSTGGRLEFAGCIANWGSHGCREPDQNSLNAADGIAVSPDGASVYATSMTGPTINGGPGAVTAFQRNPDGSLRPMGCFANEGKYECEQPGLPSLGSPESIAISPDGGTVYVGSYGKTFSIFSREITLP